MQSSGRSLSGQTMTTRSLAQTRPQALKVALPHLARGGLSRVEHMVLESNLAHLALARARSPRLGRHRYRRLQLCGNRNFQPSTLQHANADSSSNILNLGEGRAFWEPLFNVEHMFKCILASVGVLARSLVPLVIFVGSGVVIVVLEWTWIST